MMAIKTSGSGAVQVVDEGKWGIAEEMKLARTMLDYVREGTTSMAESTFSVPVSKYFNQDLWKQEIAQIFKRKPQILAFSGEIAERNSFKATDIATVPILLTRDSTGKAHAFLNACRHRGVIVTREPCGNAARFTCPYHGWTYSNTGKLIGLSKKGHFGDVDQSTKGLAELPIDERNGIIFGALTPGVSLDLENWLGPLDGILKDQQLEGAHFIGERRIDGPNWKLCTEGALETYHLQVLHPYWGSVWTPHVFYVQQMGHHMVCSVCTTNIRELEGKPEAEWNPKKYVSPTYFLFPSTQLFVPLMIDEATGLEGRFIVCVRNLPGDTPGKCSYVISVLSLTSPMTPEALAMGKKLVDTVFAVNQEDVSVLLGIEASFASGANESVTFGRNEVACHNFHRSLNELLA